MEIPKYDFDHNLYLFDLGDVHRGDIVHDNRLFRSVINTIAKNPQSAWVSTGDLLNVALKTSLSDSYKSNPLGVEFKLLMRELQPIASKCLGIVGSNHHRRFERAVGWNLDELIADTLGIPYLGISAVINITLGRATYYIAMHHGTGCGKKKGGKVNNLQDLSLIYPGADVYIEGHTHTYVSFQDAAHYIDKKRNNMVMYPAHFVTTGHFLKWKESYGEEKKYQPSPSGAAMITLRSSHVGTHTNKKVKVDLIG